METYTHYIEGIGEVTYNSFSLNEDFNEQGKIKIEVEIPCEVMAIEKQKLVELLKEQIPDLSDEEAEKIIMESIQEVNKKN